MPDTYYHLTTKENLESILKNGLIPKIGTNSASVREEKPLIYLCKEEDLPYWQILLGASACLKITDAPNDLKKFKYTLYSEYITHDAIPAEHITEVRLDSPSPNIMKELCLFYINQLSAFSVACAKYYVNTPDKTSMMSLEKQILPLLAILPRLDFSAVSKTEIRKHLIEEGEDGEYTLCDEFVGSDCKLYEKLIQYPEDSLASKRQTIYKSIITNLSGCLDINTGGWVPEDHIHLSRTQSLTL